MADEKTPIPEINTTPAPNSFSLVDLCNKPPTQAPTPSAQTVTSPTNCCLAAARATNAAIQQRGREPVMVACPTCGNVNLTEVTELALSSEPDLPRSKIQILLGGLLLSYFLFFIAIVTIYSGSFILLGAVSLFLGFLLFQYFLTRRAQRVSSGYYADLEHRCGHCKVLLGQSSGAQFFEQMQGEMFQRRI